MNKKTKNLILLFILIIILVFLIFTNLNKKSLNTKNFITYSPPLNSYLSIKGEEKNNVIFEINDKKYTTNIEGVTSIADIMSKLKKEGKIDFNEKNYAGMGKFINEINGIKNSGEKNWIYYVNNKKATIGVSNYKINKGDVISWKYEKNY
jgi:hypothetical protein